MGTPSPNSARSYFAGSSGSSGARHSVVFFSGSGTSWQHGQHAFIFIQLFIQILLMLLSIAGKVEKGKNNCFSWNNPVITVGMKACKRNCRWYQEKKLQQLMKWICCIPFWGRPPGFKISGSMGSNKGNKTLSHANFVIAGWYFETSINELLEPFHTESP